MAGNADAKVRRGGITTIMRNHDKEEVSEPPKGLKDAKKARNKTPAIQRSKRKPANPPPIARTIFLYLLYLFIEYERGIDIHYRLCFCYIKVVEIEKLILL